VNMSRLSRLLDNWWKPKKDEFCKTRRKHQVRNPPNKVAVIFSGGLDSTWTAWYLKEEGYDVELFHLKWKYMDNDQFEGPQDTEAAIKIADQLGLKLTMIGSAEAPDDNYLMLPMITSMLCCHSKYDFDFLATGLEDQRLSPSWVECQGIVEVIAKECMPWVTVMHPRFLKTKSEMRKELPGSLLSLQTTPPSGCGGCARRREKMKQWIRGIGS